MSKRFPTIDVNMQGADTTRNQQQQQQQQRTVLLDFNKKKVFFSSCRLNLPAFFLFCHFFSVIFSGLTLQPIFHIYMLL